MVSNPKNIPLQTYKIWIRQQSQAPGSVINDIFYDQNKHIYTVGTIGDYAGTIIEKFDISGNSMFSKVINPPINLSIFGSNICADLNYVYATGVVFSNLNNTYTGNVFVCKIDTFGNEVWKIKITGYLTNAGPGSGSPRIALSGDGGVFLSWGMTIIKLDTDGNIVWRKAFEGQSYSYLPTTFKDLKVYNGQIYLSGSVPSFSTTFPLIVKLDSSGNLIFSKKIQYSPIEINDNMLSLIHI